MSEKICTCGHPGKNHMRDGCYGTLDYDDPICPCEDYTPIKSRNLQLRPWKDESGTKNITVYYIHNGDEVWIGNWENQPTGWTYEAYDDDDTFILTILEMTMMIKFIEELK